MSDAELVIGGLLVAIAGVGALAIGAVPDRGCAAKAMNRIVQELDLPLKALVWADGDQTTAPAALTAAPRPRRRERGAARADRRAHRRGPRGLSGLRQ